VECADPLTVDRHILLLDLRHFDAWERRRRWRGVLPPGPADGDQQSDQYHTERRPNDELVFQPKISIQRQDRILLFWRFWDFCERSSCRRSFERRVIGISLFAT